MNYNYQIRFRLILKVFLICFGLSTATAKAQSRIDTLKQIDNVSISAMRVPEIKSQTAVSIQVISSEEINNLSQINKDVTAILGFLVPGMGMPSNTVSNRSQTLRGRSPLLLINGIPQSTPLRLTSRDLRSIDPAAIERIEIVKGATSIYGYGAVGGVINIITKENKSDKILSGVTGLSFMTNPFSSNPFQNRGGAGYDLNQQFSGTANRWSYLVSGTARRTGMAIDGEGEKISPRYGLGEVNTYNVYANVSYQTGENSKIDLKYNFYRSLQDPTLRAERGKYLERPTIGVPGDRIGVNEGTPYNHNVILSYVHDNILSHTSLNASAFYQDLYTIYDFRNAPRFGTNGGQATIRGKKYGLRAQLVTDKVFTDWLTSQFSYGIDALVDQTAQPLVDGRYWVPWLNSFNFAPFLQTKHHIAENFVWKAGVRFDHIGVSIPDYTTVLDSKADAAGVQQDVSGIHVVGGNLSYNRPTFNTGFVFTKYAYFQPFVSFAQGMAIYDLGRVLRSAKRDDVSQIITDPVITNNYEVGFNSVLSNQLDLGGSLFMNTSKLGADLVAQDGFWVVERNPQRIWGAEITAQYQPVEQWRFGASYSMQKGYSDPDLSGNYDRPLSGLLIAPSKLDLSTTFKPNSKMSLSIYYIHSGARDVFSPNENGVFEEGEGIVRTINLWNMNLNYAISSKLSCSLSAENLFNKAYYTQIAMINARDAEYTRGNGNYTTLSFRYAY